MRPDLSIDLGFARPRVIRGKSLDLTGGTFPRKEVIQPQVLLQLPCYDFTPIIDHTIGVGPPCGLARRLQVQPTFVM